MEKNSYFTRRKAGKLVSTLGATAFAISLSSCTGNQSLGDHSSAIAHPAARTISLTPNMVGFLKPGTNNTCYNGGPRPCAPLLRTQPDLSSTIINSSPTQNTVTWPLETYNGQLGDTVAIKCYDPAGERVTPYEGRSSSTDWYEVVIPENYVVNPTVMAELNQPNSSLAAQQPAGTSSLLGWASVEWFDQSAPRPDVVACSS